MKTIIQLAAVFLAITSTIYPAPSQESQPGKKGELEIGFGSSYLGPGKQMANLMREYDFDETSPPSTGWFAGGPIQHPHYNKSGITAHLTYSHFITSRSQVGIHVSYAALSEVFGYSSVVGLVVVNFSSVSIAPIYSFEPANFLEFEAGPSLMINSGIRAERLTVLYPTKK